MVIWPWNKDGDVPQTREFARSDAQPFRRPQTPTRDGGSVEILAAVATMLPDPFLVLDSVGRVLLANAHARDVLEADPEGQHLTATVRAPAMLEAVTQVLHTGVAKRVDYERRVPIERRFEAFVAPFPGPHVRNRAEDAPAVLIVLRDFTRQQQVERMRADFVANVSHELRTPLASLLGFIETLQGPAREDTEARERFLDLMKAQAERMRRLIDNLLSLSRIEMSAHERPTATVDVARVIRHVVDVLGSLARDAGVEVAVNLSGELPVKGEWDELVQVAQNLVENAIKYAAAGKRVEVTGLIEGDADRQKVVVRVRDYGPGIAPEHLPRLTERFYRVSVQESRARGGTGLGLAIVKHILNRHRGKLSIASQLGEGTTFTVKLPYSGFES